MADATETKYLDLSITDDDLTLDVARNAETLTDRDVIAQDLGDESQQQFQTAARTERHPF